MTSLRLLFLLFFTIIYFQVTHCNLRFAFTANVENRGKWRCITKILVSYENENKQIVKDYDWNVPKFQGNGIYVYLSNNQISYIGKGWSEGGDGLKGRLQAHKLLRNEHFGGIGSSTESINTCCYLVINNVPREINYFLESMLLSLVPSQINGDNNGGFSGEEGIHPHRLELFNFMNTRKSFLYTDEDIELYHNQDLPITIFQHPRFYNIAFYFKDYERIEDELNECTERKKEAKNNVLEYKSVIESIEMNLGITISDYLKGIGKHIPKGNTGDNGDKGNGNKNQGNTIDTCKPSRIDGMDLQSCSQKLKMQSLDKSEMDKIITEFAIYTGDVLGGQITIDPHVEYWVKMINKIKIKKIDDTEKLEGTINQLKVQNYTLSKLNETHTQTISSLNKTLSNSNKMVTDLNATISEKDSKITSMKSLIEGLYEIIDDKKETIKNLTASLAILNDKINNLEFFKSQYYFNIQNIKQNPSAATYRKETNNELEDRLHQCKKDLDKSTEEYNRLFDKSGFYWCLK